MKRLTFFLIFVLSTFVASATDDMKGAKEKVTGCLTKTTTGEYLLTSTEGSTFIVMGSADLEKHAMNHTVTLHGSKKTENGKAMFKVVTVDHVADTCTTPTGQ